MNRERILEIANDIEADGESRPRFNMSAFFEVDYQLDKEWTKKEDGWCNTSACIAGYVSALKYSRIDKDFCLRNHEARAQRWLVLNDETAGELFFGRGRPLSMLLSAITPAAAVLCLRELARTGKVNWAYAIKKTEETP